MKAERDEAYILHRRSFKESSVILECFSHRQGWLSLVGRGAKRTRTGFDAVLQPFIELSIEWGGRGELKTLFKAEPKVFSPVLAREALLVGFYLNELLIRLLQRGDPQPTLYQCYRATLQQISTLSDDLAREPYLRHFEKQLLVALGYGMSLGIDQHGRAVQPDILYRYDPMTGVCDISNEWGSASGAVSGAALLSLEKNEYASDAILREAKQFMRHILRYHLGEKPLMSRMLFVNKG